MEEVKHPESGESPGRPSDAADFAPEAGKAGDSVEVPHEPDGAAGPLGAVKSPSSKGKENAKRRSPAQENASGSSKRVSPYFNFSKQNRESVKAKLVSAGQKPSASELGKALGELWKSLTDEEKAAFKTVATTDCQDGGKGGVSGGRHDEGTSCAENGESSCCQLNSCGRGDDPALVQPDEARLDEQGVCQDANVEAPDRMSDDANPEEAVAPDAEDAAVPSEAEQAPFPLTKVKRIVKLDPDIRLVNIGGVTAIARATELFLESLASSAFSVMVSNKRKSVRVEDICSAIKTDRRFLDCIGTSLQCMQSEDAREGDGGDTEGLHQQEGGRPKSGTGGSKSKKVKKYLPPPPGSRCITDCFKKVTA